MSENKEINVNVEVESENQKPLTAKEIFSQISLLQHEMANSSHLSLIRLDDSITSICEGENEDKGEQIDGVCSVFMARENNLSKMLELYQRMYDDITIGETRNQKIRLLKEAFSEHSNNVKKSDLPPEEKLSAVNDITDKIAILTEKILMSDSAEATKPSIIDEMIDIIKSSDTGQITKEHAKQILNTYVAMHKC